MDDTPADPRPDAPYEQVCFSGGGIRCFWHGGFMSVAERAMRFRPRRVIGASGGALSASAFLADVEQRLVDVMAQAFTHEDSNLSWHDVDDEDGLTPHQRVYRQVVEEVLAPPAQRRVAEGPEFQIFVGTPSRRFSALHATLGGLGYELDKMVLSRPRVQLSSWLGIEGRRVDARAAAREGRLHDLVVAAATIPPVFRIPRWDGRPVCDGAMLEQAPRPEPDEGRTLFLLTRNYDAVPPDTERESYVTPSEQPADMKIDFTDPAKLRGAWSLGERDGRAWLAARDPFPTPAIQS